MPSSFAKDAKKLFGTANLYDILNLPGSKKTKQNLTQDEIKKGFYKQSLQYHPDRCTEESSKDETTQKFQIISRAYAVLANDEKRKVYDETGVIDDAEQVDDEVDWAQKWRNMFPKITMEDIEKTIKEFRESGEELEAIKESYEKNKGDMKKIMMDVMGLSYDDEDRVRAILDEMISSKQIQPTKFYIAEPAKRKLKRQKAAQKEAQEAEKALEEIQAKEGATNLMAMIQKRQVDRNSFYDDLAAKYAQPAAKKNKKTK